MPDPIKISELLADNPITTLDDDLAIPMSEGIDGTPASGAMRGDSLKTALTALFCALTGNQTVADVKTFSSFPVTPSDAPTTDYQVANKKYVDDNAGGGGGLTYSAISPTTADITLDANYRYGISASGLTADRALKFPSATAGDIIELLMLSENASYACKLQGDTSIDLLGLTATEADRLWNTGQKVSFVYTASGWVFLDDTRAFWRRIALSSPAASVSFQNIPAWGKNIEIEITAASSTVAASQVLNCNINNDTAANYNYVRFYARANDTRNGSGTAGAAGSGATTTPIATIPAASAPSGECVTGRVLIPNYTGTTFIKSFQSRTGARFGATTADLILYDYIHWWLSTSAITRVDFAPAADNLVTGSTFELRITK